MRQFSRWFLLPSGIVLALPGALFRTSGRADNLTLIVACSCYAVLISAAFFLWFLSEYERSGAYSWVAVVAALFGCMLFPLANDTIRDLPRAGLSLFATMSAVIAWKHLAGRGLWLPVLLMVIAVVADATAVVLPLAILMDRLGRRTNLRLPGIALAAAALAVAITVAMGFRPFTVEQMSGLAYAVERDALVLLMPLTLGLYGWLRSGLAYPRGAHNQGMEYLSLWTLLGLLALLVALLGAPFNPQMALLPMWFWLPAGMSEARKTIWPGQRFPSLAVCSALLLLVMLAGPIGQWRNDFFLVAFVLLPAL